MPIMNGFQACKHIRKLQKKGELSPMIVIANTADISKENIKKCIQSGFDEVIPKPVDNQEI
jgi:CheY-like chemotaxis protein